MTVGHNQLILWHLKKTQKILKNGKLIVENIASSNIFFTDKLYHGHTQKGADHLPSPFQLQLLLQDIKVYCQAFLQQTAPIKTQVQKLKC